MYTTEFYTYLQHRHLRVALPSSARIIDRHRRIAEKLVIEYSQFRHHDGVPGAIEPVAAVFPMPLERLAGRRFQADGIVEPRLLGERLEQCGHAADPVAVQILDAVGAIADRRRIGAEEIGRASCRERVCQYV